MLSVPPVLERPSGSNVPLPVLFIIAAGTALNIQIERSIFTALESNADAIFKPGIAEIILQLSPVAKLICKGGFVITAELVQQISFNIEVGCLIDIAPQIKTDAPYNTA